MSAAASVIELPRVSKDNPVVGLRAICEADQPLLRQIYASTRAGEMAMVPWNEAQKAQFLEMQFCAQHEDYQRNYADASFDLILADGEAAGRLYVQRLAESIEIIDITLLPQFRGAGIGTGLLDGLLREAAGAGQRVRIYVEQNNPALRLYRRLGFRKTGDHGIYDLMEWVSRTSASPNQPSLTASGV